MVFKRKASQHIVEEIYFLLIYQVRKYGLTVNVREQNEWIF